MASQLQKPPEVPIYLAQTPYLSKFTVDFSSHIYYTEITPKIV